MNLYDNFDKSGLDGVDNQKAWDKLPNLLKYFINSTQKMIVDKVYKKVEKKYGKSGVESLVKTSGFRSYNTNKRVNGVVDSLHLYGCAVDFAKVGIFKNESIPVCCELECIDCGRCWHIQLKRGEN